MEFPALRGRSGERPSRRKENREIVVVEEKSGADAAESRSRALKIKDLFFMCIEELDVLSRQHTCFKLLQSGTTLGSLSRLVQSLPRMIIKDEIGKQVSVAYFNILYNRKWNLLFLRC
ncbi:hypothetical protein ACJIZ3_016529 [Penstemon smallii]|uniref:Uncharacterized protein n=1 Tax=Penstemon smallii TaxID=265156 RepID=A0ABD3RQL8_9LAMI